MESSRINHEYLSQLFSISQEQQESDLVPQLYRSLLTEHERFLQDPVTLSVSDDRRKELQMRVHRLKNNYFNLGCEGVGSVLEEMYQALKTEEAARRLPQIWEKFREEAQVTLDHLRREINSLSH